MKQLFIFLMVLCSAKSFGQKNLEDLLKSHNDKSIPYISVQELAMPKTKAIVLDAREKNEFEVSHIKDAIYIGYNNFNLDEVIKNLPNKDEKIVIYCSLGIRSETIAKKVKKAGYTNVYNLYGGIFEWKNCGFSVVDSKKNETEKIHAFSKSWSKWLKKGEKVFDQDSKENND